MTTGDNSGHYKQQMNMSAEQQTRTFHEVPRDQTLFMEESKNGMSQQQ
jgi:hypothetical protein